MSRCKLFGSENSLSTGAIKGVSVMDGEQDFIGSDHRLVVADLKVNVHIRNGVKDIKVSSWKFGK